MLTQLKLKNWRSVQEATVNFTTPITVLIGANSSGKTNIIDALTFLQRIVKTNAPQFIYSNTPGVMTIGSRRGRRKNAEIGIIYAIPYTQEEVHYKLWMEVENKAIHFNEEVFDTSTKLLAKGRDGVGQVGDGIELEDDLARMLLPMLSFLSSVNIRNTDTSEVRTSNFNQFYKFLQTRLQFISEFIEPPTQMTLAGYSSDEINSFDIDRQAGNMLQILTNLKNNYPELYKNLKSDLIWLLKHINDIDAKAEDSEVRLLVTEKGRIAPTISSGTRRLVAILTAYYVLDTQDQELPGLVIVEDPDTALNPGLLQKFVGQLRDYTERKDHPRQFILTTHNPAFLDFFEPEEVRVVERDEKGFTHIRNIPEHIKNIWLDKYKLGEVWTTNSFGGLPE